MGVSLKSSYVLADIQEMKQSSSFEGRRLDLLDRLVMIPEVRTYEVNALRKAILAGTYRVHNEDIAEAIYRELRPAI